MTTQLAELHDEAECLLSLVHSRGWQYLKDMLKEQGNALVVNAMPATTVDEYTVLGFRTEMQHILIEIPDRMENRLESIRSLIDSMEGEDDA